MVIVSRRHKGLIRIDVAYSRGGGIGVKLKKNGSPGCREVCVGRDDIVAVWPSLPGCEPGKEGMS